MLSPLSLALADFDWDLALNILREHPEQAATACHVQGFFEGLGDAVVYPLHQACTGEAPTVVLLAILQAAPETVSKKESSYNRTPLHCACRRSACYPSIQILLERYPQACLQPDSLGRLPLHYALSNGADDAVLTALLQAEPQATRGVDNRGWMPLHVACNAGTSLPIVKSLLQLYPESIFAGTHQGTPPVRCLSKTAANRQELKQYLIQFKRKLDASQPKHGKRSLVESDHLMIV